MFRSSRFFNRSGTLSCIPQHVGCQDFVASPTSPRHATACHGYTIKNVCEMWWIASNVSNCFNVSSNVSSFHSKDLGWSGEKRHWSSTMNLYWWTPAAARWLTYCLRTADHSDHFHVCKMYHRIMDNIWPFCLDGCWHSLPAIQLLDQ